MLRRILDRILKPKGDPTTWRAGELAVCVDDSWIGRCRHCPRKGAVLRVAKVLRHGRWVYLAFAGNPHLYVTIAFRKPVQDDVAAEAEFTQLIKRRRTAMSPVRASEDA